MGGRTKNNSNKSKQITDQTKINQLELAQASEKTDKIIEEDDESVNISQIEPNKFANKIDANTLASAYFSASSKSAIKSNKIKVSQSTLIKV